jgi:predicted lipoprotein with Yx(FWY)xxD motif
MRSARWFMGAVRLSPAALSRAACGVAVLTVLAVVGCGGPARPAGAVGNASNDSNAGNAGNAVTSVDASRPAVGQAVASPGATASPDDDELKIPPAGPTVVQAQQDPRGPVLTDAAGFTLYTFTADGRLASRCTGQCAARWRPVSSGGKPQAGTGVSAADIGSIRRDDGGYQVTYRTAPLYYFAGDTKAGERNGADRDEFGGRFRCVPPVDTEKP